MFPQLVELDYNASFLHTSTFGVDGGLYDIDKQKIDSPTFSELLGLSCYFLHIPGVNGSKGQKHVYNTIQDLFANGSFTQNNEMFKLYGIEPSSDLNSYYKKNT